MATLLRKRVARELFSTDHRGNKLIVSLDAGDMLTFRSKGKQKTVSVYLGHCYRLAQILSWDALYKEKMEKYNQRKKSGLRAKKPKRIQPPFHQMYYKAINSQK